MPEPIIPLLAAPTTVAAGGLLDEDGVGVVGEGLALLGESLGGSGLAQGRIRKKRVHSRGLGGSAILGAQAGVVVRGLDGHLERKKMS